MHTHTCTKKSRKLVSLDCHADNHHNLPLLHICILTPMLMLMLINLSEPVSLNCDTENDHDPPLNIFS